MPATVKVAGVDEPLSTMERRKKMANWKESIEVMVEEQKKYPTQYSKNPLDDWDEDEDEEDYMFEVEDF